jgi:c-di-GMP-binding flagellar brake protein YcgR
MDVRVVVRTKKQMQEILRQIHSESDATSRTDGRRQAFRATFGAMGSITCTSAGKTADEIYISTRDISEMGLGFLTKADMRTGQTVVVTLDTDHGTIEIPGTVVHCTTTLGGKKVGVQFNLVDE